MNHIYEHLTKNYSEKFKSNKFPMVTSSISLIAFIEILQRAVALSSTHLTQTDLQDAPATTEVRHLIGFHH